MCDDAPYFITVIYIAHALKTTGTTVFNNKRAFISYQMHVHNVREKHEKNSNFRVK